MTSGIVRRAEKSKKAVSKAFEPIVISSDDDEEEEEGEAEDEEDDEEDGAGEATPKAKPKSAGSRR